MNYVLESDIFLKKSPRDQEDHPQSRITGNLRQIPEEDTGKLGELADQ
jgi:hypothetical protein